MSLTRFDLIFLDLVLRNRDPGKDIPLDPLQREAYYLSKETVASCVRNLSLNPGNGETIRRLIQAELNVIHLNRLSSIGVQTIPPRIWWGTDEFKILLQEYMNRKDPDTMLIRHLVLAIADEEEG